MDGARWLGEAIGRLMASAGSIGSRWTVISQDEHDGGLGRGDEHAMCGATVAGHV